MSIEKVRAYFEPFGMSSRILEMEMSSATVELAALAVGVEGARIAKTLSFMTREGPMLIVVAGDAKVDNKKYKQRFGQKAAMLKFEEVEELIGHAVRHQRRRSGVPRRIPQALCHGLSRLRQRQFRHRADHPGAGAIRPEL